MFRALFDVVYGGLNQPWEYLLATFLLITFIEEIFFLCSAVIGGARR